MARGAAQAQRKRAQPQPKPKRKAQSWEDQLFFARLRRHTKWMFVLLALVFAVGFVAFGVGSGSTGVGGLGDIFNSVFGKSSNGIDARISSDQKKLAANRGDVPTAIDLSTLYQQKRQNSKAIAVLEQTAKVKPKNLDLLNQIAGIYRNEVTSATNEAAAALNAISARSVTPPLADSSSILAQSLASDPLSQLLQTRYSEARTKVMSAYSKAEQAYGRAASAVRGTPGEATAQLSLAGVANEATSVAFQLRDYQNVTTNAQVAAKAYRRYLKLEPKGASANSARQVLAQLKPFLPKPKH